MNRLYYSINRGKYARRQVNQGGSTRLRRETYTSEEQAIIDKAKADGTFMKAPNGRPTNLTERQWVQVRTKAFKDWFGDWEEYAKLKSLHDKYKSSIEIDDPKERELWRKADRASFNSSAVIDENGEPLVLYHYNRYGKSDIRIFDENKSPYGFWFTTNSSPENIYFPNSPGENVVSYPVFLNIRRGDINDMTNESPTIENGRIAGAPQMIPVSLEQVQQINKWGQSIMQRWTTDETFYAVFNPNQIKSATDNIGTFSKENDDIRYMMAPGFRGTISEFQDILDSVLNNPYLRLSRAAKNNKWGRLVDYWRTQGYDVKGYYEKGRWIVASARKLDDPYYRRVDEVVTNNEAEFKRDITRFLGNFGITLKDVSEYDGEEPLFDAINKVIHFSSVEDLTDEVGYAIAFMMQRQPAITEILSTYVAFNGNEKGLKRGIKRGTLGKTKAIKLDKMTPEARQHLLRLVGKDISAELRKLYGIGEEKPSFMKKIWEAIAAFFERLTPYNRLRFDAIHNYARHVANSVKLNDKSIIISGMVKPKTSSPAERVDIAKALRENPYEEQIISTLSDYGIGLAGSASMAAVGTLYRPKENPLHDIDFMSPGMDKEKLMAILDKEYPHYIHIRSINNDGNITETFMIMDREFTMKEVPQAEGFKKSLKEIYDSEGNKIGTLTGSDLVLNEGVQGKLLDFFTGPSRFGGRIVTLNGKAYFMSDYRNAIAAKVDWVRLKDVWDYNRFILNENIVTTPDIYEGNAVISERIKKAHIIWGHPALGKTTYIEQHRDSILEWDEEINEKRFEFIRQQIDPDGKLEEAEFNARKREYMRDWKNHPEYIAFLTREWKALKERAAREHKKIFASPLPLLALFEEDFDLMVNLTNYEFLRRNQERQAGDYYSSLSWKEAVDEVLTRVNPSKVVLTNKYFNEVMSEATSQQIQQYHRDKLMYANLSQEDKDYIAERGITIEEYNRMTQVEKEVLFRCKY
jgi:hypothetical protein